MDMNPPAFQFYPDDFLGGTIQFAEVGLYIRLLCVQWSTGKLPPENHMLSSYGKGDTPVDQVKTKFQVCEDGFLRNKRMEDERKKQEAYRKSRSDNGKQGGRPKKPYGYSSLSKTKAKKSSPSPSPSTNNNTKQVEVFPEALRTEEFREAWNRWNEHLKQKGKPATPHASDLQISKLEKMGAKKAVVTINHCIEHNWQGIYEPGAANNSQPPPKQQSIFDQDWRESL